MIDALLKSFPNEHYPNHQSVVFVTDVTDERKRIYGHGTLKIKTAACRVKLIEIMLSLEKEIKSGALKIEDTTKLIGIVNYIQSRHLWHDGNKLIRRICSFIKNLITLQSIRSNTQIIADVLGSLYRLKKGKANNNGLTFEQIKSVGPKAMEKDERGYTQWHRFAETENDVSVIKKSIEEIKKLKFEKFVQIENSNRLVKHPLQIIKERFPDQFPELKEFLRNLQENV